MENPKMSTQMTFWGFYHKKLRRQGREGDNFLVSLSCSWRMNRPVVRVFALHFVGVALKAGNNRIVRNACQMQLIHDPCFCGLVLRDDDNVLIAYSFEH